MIYHFRKYELRKNSFYKCVLSFKISENNVRNIPPGNAGPLANVTTPEFNYWGSSDVCVAYASIDRVFAVNTLIIDSLYRWFKLHINRYIAIHATLLSCTCKRRIEAALSFWILAVLPDSVRARCATPRMQRRVSGESPPRGRLHLHNLAPVSKLVSAFAPNVKPFACHLCKASYKNFKSLRAHAKSHLPDGSTLCKLCGRKFSNKSNLSTHMVVKHRLVARVNFAAD
ncbi:unnamed protein product [Bemisia tabaci]|uniref:C2H2-type domain-containing protein n=1 Tax=Bemisia tabaci TaxID=7038 RepID=A0A9P0F5F4_BEMTA|nr:unnamed protein product [Bemisia tabaci]